MGIVAESRDISVEVAGNLRPDLPAGTGQQNLAVVIDAARA